MHSMHFRHKQSSLSRLGSLLHLGWFLTTYTQPSSTEDTFSEEVLPPSPNLLRCQPQRGWNPRPETFLDERGVQTVCLCLNRRIYLNSFASWPSQVCNEKHKTIPFRPGINSQSSQPSFWSTGVRDCLVLILCGLSFRGHHRSSQYHHGSAGRCQYYS